MAVGALQQAQAQIVLGRQRRAVEQGLQRRLRAVALLPGLRDLADDPP